MIKSKQYFYWLTADTLMLFTAQIRAFAVPILMLLMGGSATDAASLTAVSQIVVVFFVLSGGMIIDRFDRKFLMLISQGVSIILFLAFALCITLIGYNLPAFYLITIALAIRSALLGDVSNVILPSVVSDKELTNAMTANQARDNLIGMITSPISAALLGISNICPFVVGIIGNCVSFLATLRLKSDVPKQNPSENKTLGFIQRVKATLTDATIGAHMVVYNKFNIYLTIISLLSFPFTSGISTMLVYSLTQDSGALSASLINSARAISLVIGTALTPILTKRFSVGHIVILDSIIVFLGAAGSIFFPSIEGKLLCIIIEWLIMPSGSIVLSSLGIRIIPKDKLGRYRAFMMLLSYGITIPVQFMVGILYDNLGYPLAASIFLVCLFLSSLFVFNEVIRTIPYESELDEFIEKVQIRI